MARGKQVVVEINEDGHASVEGQDFHGPECEQAIKEITTALGEETSRQLKREHNERPVSRGIQQGRGGR